MKKLSARLSAVASLVKAGSYLADVGSDHAQLPLYLISSGKISYAMAIDNKMGPFLRMKQNVEAAGFKNQIYCSLSSGINEIRTDIDTVAICGLGGILTCELLEQHPDKLENVKHIIVDPHRDLRAVRERVTALGYYIEDERMVYEDKIYYSIMLFSKGVPPKPYTETDLCLGPVLRRRREPVFLSFLEEQRKKISDILNKNLSKEARENYLAAYRMVANELKKDA